MERSGILRADPSGRRHREGNYTGLPCSPGLTHVHGSLVSFGSPAQPGEEVVAYAVGLGSANPALVAGQPAPSAAPTTIAFNL